MTNLGANGPLWTGEARAVPAMLDEPLRWKKPRRIFVNSMSDLFHKDVPDEFIDQVIAVAILANWHTFQFLTKRAERMARYFAAPDLYERILRAAEPVRQRRPELCRVAISDPARRLPPHLWMGVSVENQECADERIPHLLAVPAAVRFLSVEPMLGPVDISKSLTRSECPECGLNVRVDEDGCCASCGRDAVEYGIDWIICGGESGPGARPFALEWAREIVAQCRAASVACFFKQAGANAIDGVTRLRLHDRKGGTLAELPGEWPREFPGTSTHAREREDGDGLAQAQGDAT